MEAELERQVMNFRVERDRLTAKLRTEEERRADLENQLKVLKNEVCIKLV